MYYTAIGTCYDGGYGWGETGQRQSMGNIEAQNRIEAEQKAQRIFPGGWRIDSIILQSHAHDGVCGCAATLLKRAS